MPPKKGNINIVKNKKIQNSKNKINKTKEKGLVSSDDPDLDKELSIEETENIEESDFDNLSEQSNEDIEDKLSTSDIESEEESEEPEPEAESEVEAEVEDVGEGDEDNCFYKYVTKKKKNLDDDEEEEVEEAEVFDDDNKVFDEIVKPEERVTKPFLSKFERVRLLGDRAKQLSLGAKPMLKNTELLNPKEIARLELEKKVIPLIIERTLPNGKKERWYIHELQIMN